MFDRLAEGRWWDRAWSLVEGCTPCSPGCDHCWLRAMERRFRGPDPESQVGFRDDRLSLPGRARKPAAWAVWSDLFHPAVKDLEISAALHCAGHASRHILVVLTKRPERMARWSRWFGDWPRNVWAGVTVCNQAEADEKIPLLLQVPAAVRFVSYEPALGPVDLRYAAFNGTDSLESLEGLHWVIAGGESGPGARPAHPDWFRSVRDQCQAAGVPFLFKQWGEWIPSDQDPDYLTGQGLVSARPAGTGDPCCPGLWRRVGKKRAGRLLDGVEHNALPEVPHVS
jgi:protein gp37